MSECRTCISIDCDFPSDLDLYSLDGLQFFLNGQLYPIIYCPPGFDCNPLASGFIYFQCCAHTLQRGVSGGMPYAEIQALVQSMVAECQGLGCGSFPPGKPVVPLSFYFNKAQTAEFFCPDLSSHFYTVPAGTFVGANQSDADALALALAKKNLASQGCCIQKPRLTGSPGWICSGGEVTMDPAFNIYRITGSNSAATYNWSIVDGALPAGVTLVDMGFDFTVYPPQAIAQLQGIATVPGVYQYTVQAIRPGFPQSAVQVVDVFSVFGITNDTLPNATVGTPYSQQLLTAGGTLPVTFTLHPANAMPPGLTLHSDGTVDGTPGDAAVSGFEVDILDADGGACTQTVTLTVVAAVGCPDFTTTVWPGPIGPHWTGTVVGTGAVLNGNIAFPGPFVGLMNTTGHVVQTGGPCNCNLHLVVTVLAGVGQFFLHAWDSTISNDYLGINGYPVAAGTYDFPFTLPSADTYYIEVDFGGHVGCNVQFVCTYTNI